MRVRFGREWERYGAGLLTELADEQARMAIDAGAAVEMYRVRLTKDFRHGGQTFAANFDYDLTAEQLEAARKAGAAEKPKAEATPAAEAVAGESASDAAPRRAKRERE